jgi:hypothetical protein
VRSRGPHSLMACVRRLSRGVCVAAGFRSTPVLATLLGYVATTEDPLTGASLLLAYTRRAHEPSYVAPSPSHRRPHCVCVCVCVWLGCGGYVSLTHCVCGVAGVQWIRLAAAGRRVLRRRAQAAAGDESVLRVDHSRQVRATETRSLASRVMSLRRLSCATVASSLVVGLGGAQWRVAGHRGGIFAAVEDAAVIVGVSPLSRKEMPNLEDPAAAVPVLPGGGAWPFRPFSLSFSSPGAGFSPFWWGLQV